MLHPRRKRPRSRDAIKERSFKNARVKTNAVPDINRLFDDLRRYGLDKRADTAVVMQALAYDPDDAIVAQHLQEILDEEKEVCRITPDPLRATTCWQKNVLTGELTMGCLVPGDVPYAIPPDMLKEHVAVMGRTGGGKTTLIRTLLHALKTARPDVHLTIIERKQEFTDIARLHGMNVILANDLRINPLRPPQGVSLGVWLGIFTQNMVNYLDIRTASSNYIHENAKLLFKNHGIDDGNIDHFAYCPTLRELLELIRTTKHSSYSHTARYQETTVNRLQGLLDCMPEVFCSSKALDVREMINEDLLILVHDIPRIEFQNFLTSLIASQLFLYRIISQGQTEHLTNLLVLDEAASLFRRSDEIRDIPNYFAQIIVQARAYGIGIIAASQYASDLSHALLANTAIKILAGGFERTEDFNEYLHLRPHDASIADAIKSARKPGDLFVADSRWPHHLRINIPLPETDTPMTSAQIAHTSRQYADERHWHGASPPPDCTSERSHSVKKRERKNKSKASAPVTNTPQTKTDDLRLLVLQSIHQHPYLLIRKRADMLNRPLASILKVQEQLIAKGLIIQYPVHARPGKPRDLFEITPAGCSILHVTPHTSPGKGGFLHKFYQQRIATFYKNKGYDVKIEGLCGNKLADLLIRQQPDGEIIAIEIELHARQHDQFLKNLVDDLESGIPKQALCLVPKKVDLLHASAKIRKNEYLKNKITSIHCDYLRHHMENES